MDRKGLVADGLWSTAATVGTGADATDSHTHDDEGRHVVFGDGLVKWVPFLDRTKMWANSNTRDELTGGVAEQEVTWRDVIDAFRGITYN